jgi:hypothetical protein
MTEPEHGDCFGYHTLHPGDYVASCVDGRSDLCAFGSCAEVADHGFMCTGNTRSIYGVPTWCSTDSDCVSTFDSVTNQTLYGKCGCGANGFGDRVCSLFPADIPLGEYIGELHFWHTSSNITLCNTVRRHEPRCILDNYSDIRSALKLVNSYYKVNDWIYIQENDECVQQIITHKYWDSVLDLEEVAAINGTIDADDFDDFANLMSRTVFIGDFTVENGRTFSPAIMLFVAGWVIAAVAYFKR